MLFAQHVVHEARLALLSTTYSTAISPVGAQCINDTLGTSGVGDACMSGSAGVRQHNLTHLPLREHVARDTTGFILLPTLPHTPMGLYVHDLATLEDPRNS